MTEVIISNQDRTDRYSFCDIATFKEIGLEREINRVSEIHEYPGGVELFQQGFKANFIYLIERGVIKLVCLDHEGNEIILDLRYPGHFLGLSAVIVKRPH